ncbi:unnamed protein product [Aureobasidium vineae]|uniref:Integral membrane protein n=1 Tax=Aureobasidium vineae TaxID=2773715 RepID=A0A9N8JI83_9PEZI|nr:unnamed protein product [Aureobasidium vineae]
MARPHEDYPSVTKRARVTSRLSRSYTHSAARLGLSTARFTVYGLILLSIFTTTLLVRSASSRDPGSWFFNPSSGYSQRYSAFRQQQAERFVEAAVETPPYRKSNPATGLCVGIPSVARDGARYLRTTVGSLLAGLSQEERAGMYLMVFLPHSDPNIHPAFQEAWLSNLVDEIVLYNVSNQEMEYIESLELKDVEHRTKGLYDYNYLMKACHAKNTPYIALLEDDVVAMDGWYHRTVYGIHQAETRSRQMKPSRDFLYLRMFYTEEFLGWNNENWPTYAFWSVLFISGSICLVFGLPMAYQYPKRLLTPRLSLAIVTLIVPWAVVMVFAAGKATVLPLPEGINEMNNFGCCAQGLVFPRHKALDLIEWFTTSRVGFADMLIEQYANEHGEQRWALTPSIIQHIGSKSSKPDDFGHGAKFSKPVSATIWNFAFEIFVPEVLRNEHKLAGIDAVTLGRSTAGA